MRSLAQFCRREDGVAAIEMALIGSLFSFGLLNVAEFSRYSFSTMEYANATQAGADAALAACDVAHTPATLNCSALTRAVDTALKSTSLGAKVALNGSMTEGYYCLGVGSAANQMTYVGGPTSPPADCTATSNDVGRPALYLSVPTTYTYTPMFPGLTIVDALPKTLTRTAWMRMQ